LQKVADEQRQVGGAFAQRRNGDGKDIQERFRKLDIFYRQVLAKTGFNTYSDINIQFEGQVVATKRNSRYVKSDTMLSRQWMKMWLSVPDTMKDKPSAKNPVPGKPKETGTKGAVPAEKTKPKAVMPQAEKES
jgi:cell division protein FtsQ